MRQLLVLLSFCFGLLYADIVINEIMIDPVGADEGYEWIELYNNSDEAVDLSGWKIQSAGTSFITNYTISDYIISPYDFLLIAEEYVPNADLYANLSFQNGGSASDGIRIISHDLSYTDTFIYDRPNINNLADDVNDPAIEMFSAIETGKTVARKTDGFDSNCINDWQIANVATPGASNTDYIDIKIGAVSIDITDNYVNISIFIHNLSTTYVPASTMYLELIIDNNIYDLQPIGEFGSENFINLSTRISNLSTGIHNLKIKAHCMNDIDMSNNAFECNFLIGESPVYLNEVMHSPLTGKPEWIELYNQSDSTIVLDDMLIVDLSGSKTRCFGEINSREYKVLCPDKVQLLQNYPFLTENQVIQTYSWAALNNNGDAIVLYLEGDVPADSMAYGTNSTPKGVSLERQLLGDEIVWQTSQAPYGATPGMANTGQPNLGGLQVLSKDLNCNGSYVEHKIRLMNLGSIDELDLLVYQQINHDEMQLVYENYYIISDSLQITFETALNTNAYTFYQYVFSQEIDGEEQTIICKNVWLDNKLPFVINEIMYNPNNAEPEWIEIKTNDYFPQIDSLYLYDSQSFVGFPMVDSEYIIITSTRTDTIWLKNNHDLENIPIFYGLPNLSNNGEDLILKDNFNNVIEHFVYKPSWSKVKGVSIERMFSNAVASDQNWGACRSTSTIGKPNSLQITNPGTQGRISYSQKTFSPYRYEQTNIAFYYPEDGVEFRAIIFDLNGRKVKEMRCELYSGGYYTIIWDGKNRHGKNVLPGIYPIYLEAGKNNKSLLKKRDRIVIAY